MLARHGIGVMDDEFIHHEAGDQARAEHLRRACEDLGTLFIKLGQVLSTRADLLPDAYRVELAKLQDEVAPLPACLVPAGGSDRSPRGPVTSPDRFRLRRGTLCSCVLGGRCHGIS